MNKELEEALKKLKEVLYENIEFMKKENKSFYETMINIYLKRVQAIETALNYIENSIPKEEYNKIKEENETLKLKERNRVLGKYGEIEIHDLINKVLSEDYIPKEKVKEKLQELLEGNENGRSYNK